MSANLLLMAGPDEEGPLPDGEGGHPDPFLLEMLMTGGDVAREDVRKIVRHLLSGCPRCAAIARRFHEVSLDRN